MPATSVVVLDPGPDPDRPTSSPCHPREAAQLVAAGWLRELLPGVLVAVDVQPTPQLRAGAVIEVAPPQVLAAGILCAGTAAWLWAGGAPPHPLDVVVPSDGRGARLRSTPQVRVREQRLFAADVVPLAGLRLTSPVRTAVDLARGLPVEGAVPALRALSAATGVTPRQVGGYLRGLEPVPGLRRARAAVAAWRAAAAGPGAQLTPRGACP